MLRLVYTTLFFIILFSFQSNAFANVLIAKAEYCSELKQDTFFSEIKSLGLR